MSKLTISAEIVLSPNVAGSCSFPGALTTTGFSDCDIPAGASAYRTSNLNSPNAFVALDGIASGGAVTQGQFFYFRTAVPMRLELTWWDPLLDAGVGDDVVSEIPVQGELLYRLPPTAYLKGVRVKGQGSIEYLATGAS